MVAKYLLAVMLIVVGVIHLVPGTGFASVERLNGLYGLAIDDSNLAILLRHRAILFGLLGVFLIYAAFRPSLQLVALIAGAASVISFLCLAYSTGSLNEELTRVVAADLAAAACLVVGFAAYFSVPSGERRFWRSE